MLFRQIEYLQDGQPVTKNYCAFWKRSNRNPCAAEFAGLLKETFRS